MKKEEQTIYATPALEVVELRNEHGFAASLPQNGTSSFENENEEGSWD